MCVCVCVCVCVRERKGGKERERERESTDRKVEMEVSKCQWAFAQTDNGPHKASFSLRMHRDKHRHNNGSMY